MAAPSKPVIAIFVGNEGVEAAGVRTVAAVHARGGCTVRVVVRKLDQALPDWKDWGCEILAHDVRRPGSEKIFKDDCNTAFWTTPTSQDRAQLTEDFLKGCIDNGIDFPVVLSAAAAESAATTHLAAFADVEARCKRLAGTKVKEQFWDKGKQILQPIILRTGLYYESLYALVPTLKEGFLYLPMSQEQRAPYVGLDDVAEVASEILQRPDQWADRTLEISTRSYSGGELSRSLTMHARDGGVKFEPIDIAVAEAAYVKSGLVGWVAKANAELVNYYGKHSIQVDSDIDAVLGRKATQFASFAKSMKAHIQSDRPIEVPTFVKNYAVGHKKKAAAAAAPAGEADGADAKTESSEVRVAAAQSARDSAVLVTLSAAVANADKLKAAAEGLIDAAEGGSKCQMLECFTGPGNSDFRLIERYANAEDYLEHLKFVGPKLPPMIEALSGAPTLTVCGKTTVALAGAIDELPGGRARESFKRFAGFTTYKFSSAGVPQGRRHGVMTAVAAGVRDGRIDELKEFVASKLIPLIEGDGLAQPLAYEWYTSADGSRVMWFEKHANSADAIGTARKAAALTESLMTDFLDIGAGSELIIMGAAKPDLLKVLSPLKPVVYDKVVGFTRFEM